MGDLLLSAVSGDCDVAAGNWAAIGLLLALVFAWMRRRLAASPPSEHAHIRLRARVAALFCAGFVPILYTLVDGMIDLWLTLGVMAAIFWALDGRKALAGALLGVAIVTKIAPVLWLPGFALLLGWRGAAAAIGVAFGYEAAIWAAGWGPWEVHLVTHVLPKWPYLPQLPSFSLYHIALHWSARFGAGEAESAAWGARALMAGRVAASACYAYVLWRVWQVWRQGREGGRDGQIEAKNNDDVSENPDIRNPAHPLWPAALAMLASFYLSPLMEPNHLIWLAAPVAGVLLEGRGPLRARDIGLVVAVWALGLLCYELTQTMNLWWGFQVAFAAPILAALLFLPRPSQKNDASTGEANPQGPKGIYSSS